MDQSRLDLALLEGALDLAEARYDLPALAATASASNHACVPASVPYLRQASARREVALKALINLVTAGRLSATARCEAETHRPAGKLALQIRDHLPWGDTTKRISSSIGRTCRVNRAHPHGRGPVVRGHGRGRGSAKASMRVTWLPRPAALGGSASSVFLARSASVTSRRGRAPA